MQNVAVLYLRQPAQALMASLNKLNSGFEFHAVTSRQLLKTLLAQFKQKQAQLRQVWIDPQAVEEGLAEVAEVVHQEFPLATVQLINPNLDVERQTRFLQLSISQEALAAQQQIGMLQRQNEFFRKFVPMAFLKLLGNEELSEMALGHVIQREMTVLFASIRSFSNLSDSMSAEENFRFINSYLNMMGPLIKEHRGFIEKYQENEIMALFPETVDDSVKTAIEMIRLLNTYNEGRKRAGYVPISIGIGVNTGMVRLGTIGEAERIESTIFSESVDLASRLERLTRAYKTSLLITENTFYQLQDPSQYYTRFIDRIKIKGVPEPVSIFEVYNADSQEEIDLKSQTVKLFEQAFYHYLTYHYKDAAELFQQCLNINPSDKTAEIYLSRCRHYSNLGHKPAGTRPVATDSATKG